LLRLIVRVPGPGSGGGTAGSGQGWLTIAGHRIGQQAEFAKLSVVLMLARVLAQRRGTPKSMLDLWKPIVVVAVPMLLILKQPDLGTGIVFVGIFFVMLFWAGVPWKLLLLLASPVISLVLAFDSRVWGAWLVLMLGLLVWYKPYLGEGVALALANVAMGVVAPLLWDSLKPYQQARLKVFIDPTVDPRGAAYHVNQSRVAIGSGGWLGRGFTQGPQKRLAFLPEQHTDFIFAVVGEELGYLGVLLALALFGFGPAPVHFVPHTFPADGLAELSWGEFSRAALMRPSLMMEWLRFPTIAGLGCGLLALVRVALEGAPAFAGARVAPTEIAPAGVR